MSILSDRIEKECKALPLLASGMITRKFGADHQKAIFGTVLFRRKRIKLLDNGLMTFTKIDGERVEHRQLYTWREIVVMIDSHKIAGKEKDKYEILSP